MYESEISDYSSRKKRDTAPSIQTTGLEVHWEYFNLTGDTLDINDEENETRLSEDDCSGESNITEDVSNDTDTIMWWKQEADPEEIGYFYDTAWEANVVSKFHNVLL